MSQVIPSSWTSTELSNIVDFQNGFAFKSQWFVKSGKYQVLKLGNVKVSQLKLESSPAYVSEEIALEYKSYQPQKDDILITMTGTRFKRDYGFVCRVDQKVDALINQRVGRIRNNHDISDSKYLSYFLMSNSFQDEFFEGETGGVSQGNVGSKHILSCNLFLPPLAEQQVIADKLDELLAQVESTKVRLDAIPAILKSFRQSVLAAAVSGKLTEEWRERKGNIWQLLTIGDLGEVKGGKRLPKGEELVEQNTGFPYIRAGQLKLGTVISTNDARSKQLFLTPETQSKISRYTVDTGDLYLTIVGASIGDAGVIPGHYSGANLTENAAKITDFKKPVESEFLSYWLRSQELQDLIKLEIKSGAQGKLALKRIKELPAPYTDISEQTEIVRRVEELFAFADKVEAQVNAAQARVNNLTQSILAKAFRGELTADWRAANPELISGDNSAEALLEKIKVERQSMQGKKTRKKA